MAAIIAAGTLLELLEGRAEAGARRLDGRFSWCARMPRNDATMGNVFSTTKSGRNPADLHDAVQRPKLRHTGETMKETCRDLRWEDPTAPT